MIPCISYISFTTDFWSSNSSDQFLSLTGHCTFENFDVQAVVLYAQPFTERHTGVNITETIDTMIEEYSIPDHKVNCIAVARFIVDTVLLSMLNFEIKYRSEMFNAPIRVHPYDT